MPKGNRLFHAALRGCLIGGLFCLSPALAIPLYAQDVENNAGIEAEQDKPAAKSQTRPTDPTPPATAIQRPDAAPEDQRACTDQQDCARKDLIAQDRMAKATDQIVGISREQVRVGIGGLILGALTVCFAWWAAFAASNAAKSASAAVEEAEKTTILAQNTLDNSRISTAQELRAYIHVESVERIPAPEYYKSIDLISINIRNYGQTPAYNVIARAQAIWEESEDAVDFKNINFAVAAPSVCGPSQKHTVAVDTPGEFARSVVEFANKRTIFIVGSIEYLDAFGESHTTAFRMFNSNFRIASFGNCSEGNEAD